MNILEKIHLKVHEAISKYNISPTKIYLGYTEFKEFSLWAEENRIKLSPSGCKIDGLFIYRVMENNYLEIGM